MTNKLPKLNPLTFAERRPIAGEVGMVITLLRVLKESDPKNAAMLDFGVSCLNDYQEILLDNKD